MSGEPREAQITELWETTQADVARAFGWVRLAEEEIAKAQARHPDAAALLWHALPLLAAPPGMPGVEFVYAGHVRELLARLADGGDTRLPTSAEICLICSEASLHAPLVAAATGLYMRAWVRAFPGHPVTDDMAAEAAWLEQREGYQMREMERELNRRAAVPGRRLAKDLQCDGEHDAGCRFAGVRCKNREESA